MDTGTMQQVIPPYSQSQITFVGFEIFAAVVMESTIFWDITPCSPLKVNLLHAAFLLSLFFRP
jgi:hypothetical protein